MICACGHADGDHNNSDACQFEGGCGCKAYDEAAPEPPVAWRASTARAIAQGIESAIANQNAWWLNGNWAAFLRQEADRIDGGEK